MLNANCVCSNYISVATTFFTFLAGQQIWKFIWVKGWLLVALNSFSLSHTNIYPKNLYSSIQVWSVSYVIIQFGGILCFGVSSAGQLFTTNMTKKTNKSDYKCGLSVSILLEFVFHIPGKVKEIFLSQKNATEVLLWPDNSESSNDPRIWECHLPFWGCPSQ